MPSLSILERKMARNCFSKGLISSLYNKLLSGSNDSSNYKLEAWRSGLKEDIQMDVPDTCLRCSEFKGPLNTIEYRTVKKPIIVGKV